MSGIVDRYAAFKASRRSILKQKDPVIRALLMEGHVIVRKPWSDDGSVNELRNIDMEKLLDAIDRFRSGAA